MTTKGASFSYEEIIDLHTESDRVTVIGIHTPTNDTPRRMAPGLFAQFKKFKYIGCNVAMVPAATLPVDPLGVRYEGGEAQTDPRDMLNPILFHGCHGNDLGNILNRIYSAHAVEGSDLSQLLHTDSTSLWSLANNDEESSGYDLDLSLLESLYYRALTDRTWQKAHIQRGFRKSGLHPRIYSLATNMQLQNAEYLAGNQFPAPSPFSGQAVLEPFETGIDVEDNASYPVRFFTPRTVRLGWLDTRQVVGYSPSGDLGTVGFDNIEATLESIVAGKTVETKLPRIYMGVILLPPAYKTEQYFRMIITHKFAFAGFRGISMSDLELGMPPNYRNLNPILSTGGNDDPDDPDDPDPPSPPTPPAIAEKIVLSMPRTLGSKATYDKMEIYDSFGNVCFSLVGNANANVIRQNVGADGEIADSPVLGTISGNLFSFPLIYLRSADGGINFTRQNSDTSYTLELILADFLTELDNNGNEVTCTLTTMAALKTAWQYEVVIDE